VGSLWGGSAAARTVVRDDNLRAELRPFEHVALAAFESHDHLAVGAVRRKLSGAQATWATSGRWATPATPGGVAAAPQPLAGLRTAWSLLLGRVAPPRARRHVPAGRRASCVTFDTLRRLREILALFDKALRGPAAAGRRSMLVGVSAHCTQGGCRLSCVEM
jgi:hypothetical protein